MYDHLNEEQLLKGLSRVNRRIGNLEARYGGVIGTGMRSGSRHWELKKNKLVAERDDLRTQLGILKKSGEPYGGE